MPRIFLSYNRADGKAGLVDAFIEDLADEIERAKGWPEGDIFYVDVQGTAGVDWHQEIVAALRECDVFMPLLSPRYFTSEYCGKEWGLFERRLARHQTLRGGRPKAIVPVLWEGLPDRSIVPDFVGRLQWFGPDTGLRRLVQQSGRYKEDLAAHREGLAATLAGVAEQQRPLAADEDWGEFTDAVNVFAGPLDAPVARAVASNGAPDVARWEQVNFVVAAATATEISRVRNPDDRYRNKAIEWRPYGTSLVQEANRVALDRKLTAIPRGLDDGLQDMMRKAKREHELVILLVDPWTLDLTEYRPRIEWYDEMRWLHTGVLVVWDEKDPETTKRRAHLEALVDTTFHSNKVLSERKKVLTYSDSAGSLSQFEGELQKVIAYIESLLIAEPPDGEVRTATPEDLAESDALASPSRLDGPGGADR